MSSLAVRLSSVKSANREVIAPVLAIVSRRLANNRLLVLAGLVGVVVAVTLVTAIPLYANAIATKALRQELAALDSEVARPRATILFTYEAGRTSSPVTRAQFSSIDSFLKDGAATLPALVPQVSVAYIQTDPFPLVAEGKQGVRETRGDVFFASLEGLLDHVDILEGRPPNNGNEFEALISTEGLDELGLAVGKVFDVAVPQARGTVTLPVRIVGRWYPRDTKDPYWFNRPEYYKDALFVNDDVLFGGVLSVSPRSLREYTRYVAYDPSQASVNDVDGMLAAISRLQVGAQQTLRGMTVDSPMGDVLDSYRRKAFFLQVLLFVTSAPILVIVFQFVASAAGMLVDGQKDEIATLKSRGATTKHIVSIYVVEWLMLGGVAVVAGVVLGGVLAELMGFNAGFLSFRAEGLLPLRLTPDIIAYAIAAACLGVLAALVPVLEVARHSIVTYKHESARNRRSGIMRRYFLDIFPLPIAGYAYYMLLQQRSVLPVGEGGDTFSDPLLLLAPALFIFAVSLLFLRLFPLLIALIERLVGHFLDVSALMALRQISRQPQQYYGLILLLTLTLALGAFSASVAATLDNNYRDAATYRVGTDLRMAETGVYDEDSQDWTLVPIGEHLAVPGVEAAARVLRVTATEKIGTRGGELTVLGIDPGEFNTVAYWRRDYADQPLDLLTNELANDDTGVLVDRRLADAYHLQIGDQISVSFKGQNVDFTVAGILQYFPTLYPDSGRFLVANIDYLFAQLGSQPYDVWLKLKPGASATSIVDQLKARDVPVVRFESLSQVMADKQRDTTRLGTFGILSIGFIVAALLTVLSVLLHSYLSFRRRMQQLGLMRAIGLSTRQLTTLYLVEQGLLLALGAAAGTLLGYLASVLFIPFLQIRMEQQSAVPPFVVLTSWGDIAKLYLVLVVFLAFALPFSLSLLKRIRIHDAIKLGEERG